MSARIREVQAGELTWYVASAFFATGYAARQAWEQVDAKVPTGSLGLYRHGPTEHRGQVVTVVASSYREALKAARLLRTGTDYALDEVTLEALIRRRALVVLEYGQQGAGRVKWRRPDGRGAELRPDGTMVEPTGADE